MKKKRIAHPFSAIVIEVLGVLLFIAAIGLSQQANLASTNDVGETPTKTLSESAWLTMLIE